MNKFVITVLLLVGSPGLHAETINLECGALAQQMVDKLVDEGLLLSGEQHQVRARAISVELCQGVQKSAENQHQKAKTTALQNWIFENRPDKPGNRRLKGLK